jgi:hypothetical protein
MFVETRLYTSDGKYVTMVLVPPLPSDQRPLILLWRSRCFLFSPSTDQYRECFALPVFTKDELHAAAHQGLVT